jgi:hypothetical protein
MGFVGGGTMLNFLRSLFVRVIHDLLPPGKHCGVKWTELFSSVLFDVVYAWSTEKGLHPLI